MCVYHKNSGFSLTHERQCLICKNLIKILAIKGVWNQAKENGGYLFYVSCIKKNPTINCNFLTIFFKIPKTHNKIGDSRITFFLAIYTTFTNQCLTWT